MKVKDTPIHTHKERERDRDRETNSVILYGISCNSHPQNSTKQSRRPTAVVKEQLRSFVCSFNKHLWSTYDVSDRYEGENMSITIICCKISYWKFPEHLP